MEILQRMALAIAIGALVGVERHWRERDEDEGSRTAGIRTYTLIGMLGGLAGLLEHLLAQPGALPGLVLVGFLVTLTAVFALFQYREGVAEHRFSATAVVAAMLTFALGALALIGDTMLASAGGVVLAVILASREFLHRAIRRLRWVELRSALILLTLAFVLRPIVPTEPIGPFGGVSPAKILIMAIVLAAISFCGYIAVRLLGATRGELVAGTIGGLISSTATTIANARRSRQSPAVRALAAGAVSAGGVSLLRTGFLVVAVLPSLAERLLLPLAAGAAAMFAGALLLARASSPVQAANPEPNTAAPGKPEPSNPFDLASVFKMALLLVGVAFAARVASQLWGDGGLYAASALAGLADVDAVTVTVAGMLPTLDPAVAARALGLAVLANMLAKVAYAGLMGTRAFALALAGASALALLAAGASLLLR
ncbi:MgtC/SapB family protein [Ancylobacter sp. FA202]|uniref:MgtC/SapB family protein n=1 Tax=Ancylobacter sp. FA202 TaxID=1111106 RepID=UPI001FD9C155|nr:MgtC/SapB family protein [Ancylobacter sp. FA202]